MGARWLKAEEAAITVYYPTATRAEMLERIPNRTWAQIGVKARKMGYFVLRKQKGTQFEKGARVYYIRGAKRKMINATELIPISLA